MILVTAATQFELDGFLATMPFTSGWEAILTGVGPVEAALQVAAYLARNPNKIQAVVNFGVGGAYIREGFRGELLDICLAEREILGDLGICNGEQVIPLRLPSLDIFDSFSLVSPALHQTARLLEELGISFHRGNFITVNGASGTRSRGDALGLRHDGLCENMEGAAVAQVCQYFQLPLIELRCISNLVEDRNTHNWRLTEASQRCGQVVAQVVEALLRPSV